MKRLLLRLRPIYAEAKVQFVFYGRVPFVFYYSMKVLHAVVPMKWYTFEEICALGCPEWAAETLLYLWCSGIDPPIVETRLAYKITSTLPDEAVRHLNHNLKVEPDTACGFDYRWLEDQPYPDEVPSALPAAI